MPLGANCDPPAIRYVTPRGRQVDACALTVRARALGLPWVLTFPAHTGLAHWPEEEIHYYPTGENRSFRHRRTQATLRNVATRIPRVVRHAGAIRPRNRDIDQLSNKRTFPWRAGW